VSWFRALVAALGAITVVCFGGAVLATPTPIASAAPIQAQSSPADSTPPQAQSTTAGSTPIQSTSPGGLSLPNPFDRLTSLLSPDNLGKLVQDTAAYLLKQMVNGLQDLLVMLTQGNDNVITHTPPTMTYQQQGVIQRHDALLHVVDLGFAVALVLTGILVMLGPNSPLSYPVAGEVVPRVIIAYIAAHSSLQWTAWFIDLSNTLCSAVAPADPFPLTSGADLGSAFALLGLALLYGIMAVFLGLFMFVRVKLIALLLILAPAACVLWIVPGRPRQWAELWMDLFFSNLFVQFIQVLALSIGVELLQTAGGDGAGFMQFLSGAATLLLVFRIPALVNAAVGGGATSFLGIVALGRGLQQLGVRTLSLQAQQSITQVASNAPGAAWNLARHPRATVTSALTREWQQVSNSPAGQAAQAVGSTAAAAASRLRDEAVVRRGI